jgi:hypothetical protein
VISNMIRAVCLVSFFALGCETAAPPSQKPTEELVREWLPLAFVVLGALWAYYEFRFKQRSLRATLAVSSGLEIVARSENHVLLRATVRVVNRTSVTVHVPALWYNVRARKLRARQLDDAEYAAAAAQLTRLEQRVARFSNASTGMVVASQVILGDEDGGFYNPTEETLNESLFYVPEDEFDYLEMKVCFYMLRSRRDLERVSFYAKEDGSLARRIWLKPGWKFGGHSTEFDPTNPKHKAWRRSAGASQGWVIATLAIGAGSEQTPTPA